MHPLILLRMISNTFTSRLEKLLFDPRLWAGLLFLADLYWLDLPLHLRPRPHHAVQSNSLFLLIISPIPE
jgi:hypothetical protein